MANAKNQIPKWSVMKMSFKDAFKNSKKKGFPPAKGEEEAQENDGKKGFSKAVKNAKKKCKSKK